MIIRQAYTVGISHDNVGHPTKRIEVGYDTGIRGIAKQQNEAVMFTFLLYQTTEIISGNAKLNWQEASANLNQFGGW